VTLSRAVTFSSFDTNVFTRFLTDIVPCITNAPPSSISPVIFPADPDISCLIRF
jgi:hypothetical protein